jgi:3-methyladenine DNA glycosylase AlkC
MKEKFSLKDFLFNWDKLTKIALEIQNVYPEFKADEFVENTTAKFPELELKQRISWIREQLKKYLPADYRTAVQVLVKSLPPPNDITKSDNDFGDFIYAPYNDFVSHYGRNKKDLTFSLEAINEITQRFSAEDAIRYFINDYPKETLATLLKWSTDPHYHVRRLASEGTRPKLPWSQKINLDVEKPIPLLDQLFSDSTRFVTRSVANHLNDISKVKPDLVLETLTRWQKSEKQNTKEMEFIIKHSLRTLVKKGYPSAIRFLNFSTEPEVRITNFIISPQIRMGESLEYSFTLTALKDERLVIDYVIYFQNKAGKLTNSKIFKLKQLELKRGDSIIISKKHKFIENMTTRTLYPGKHIIEIQINGKRYISKEFNLFT